MTKPRLTIVTVGAAAVLAVFAVLILRVPLMSPSALRTSLLQRTPIDAPVGDVRAVSQQHGWFDTSYIGSTGFLRQEPRHPRETIGVSSLRGHLGHYYGPFRIDVTTFWGFDDSGRLIDVWVWKTVDAL